MRQAGTVVERDEKQSCSEHSCSSPLGETAARLSGLSEYVRCWVGIPAEPGWHRLTDLGDPELLYQWHLDVIDTVGDRRAAAAFMSNWLMSFIVGGWLLPVLFERRLPLADDADIAVRRVAGGWFDALAMDDNAINVLPGDPDADHPSATVLSSDDEMFDALTARLSSLGPLVEALRCGLPIGLPALWGTVADAVASQALLLAGLTGGDKSRAWREADAIIERLAARRRLSVRPRRFTVRHDGGEALFGIRGTCCLYYRTCDKPDRNGEGYCDTCPIRTDESRAIRLRASVEG